MQRNLGQHFKDDVLLTAVVCGVLCCGCTSLGGKLTRNAGDLIDTPIQEKNRNSQLPDGVPLETEEQTAASEEDVAEWLTPNLWVKNLALETGTKFVPISKELQRRDEINELNMSEDERAKHKNKKYEYVNGADSDWRWLHRGVEQLFNRNTSGERFHTEVFLQSAKYKDKKLRILRGNAAIVLGREGNLAVKKYLLQMVSSDTFPLPARCAAAETLGRMEGTKNDVANLIATPNLSQELHEELLYALAGTTDPWEHTCFLEALSVQSFDVRYAAAKIWRNHALHEKQPAKHILDTFIECYRTEGNPQIRVEMMKALGAWNVPDLYKLVAGDLNSGADVRNAAMDILAENQCTEAIPAIKNKLHDSVSVNRAAAVSALRKLGCTDEALKMSKDEDQRVRCEVAKALCDQCTPQTAILAKKYAEDRYEKVQHAAVAAVADWNVIESGETLLAAVKSPFPKVRQRAADILAAHGVYYQKFDPKDSPKNQTENVQELTQLLQDKTGVDRAIETPPQRKQPAVTQISAINALETGTIQERRRAAAELAKTLSVETPSDDAVKKLLQIIQQQNDPMMLTTLSATLKNADPDLVRPAALTMLQAETPEVRRLSCELLKHFGTADDLPALNSALHDANKSVTRGALSAIDSLVSKDQGMKRSEIPRITQTLKQMLHTADPSLQTDIAATLHRLGSQEGSEAIRRLALSKDVRLKCYVAKTLAGLQDEEFIPILLNFLDDNNGSVKAEALKALPAITGKDVASGADSHTAEVSQTQRQISLWKTWAASRQE